MARQPMIVLIGGLDPMTRVGMATLLRESDVRVVDAPQEAGTAAGRLRPDAVVLPMSSTPTELGDVRAGAPGAKVVLWAKDESEMQVYDAGAQVPRRIAGSTPAALIDELLTPRMPPREE